ncbi:putative nucleic acid-binding protein [Variovorax sp. TBS-050B]|uniref:DUF4411 family protein n=1 Tax=Variovorax sp. TBS-050B TaxID=2940551 RepID=UPI0024755E7B|nr:DUF4411 family protein [Variovorax sp. TBS-050B]MDH6592522.1 putative nucleic acid-binding protein [Variovorax sp. TBS-050B]
MSYLLDSNTLIEAKNRYYQMRFCPGYWTWLTRTKREGRLASVESVSAELRRGNDELAQWVKSQADLFLAESDEATQTAFAEIAGHLAAQTTSMKAGALDEFLSGADPWLIAKARVTGHTIVTHERLNLQNRKKFLIPNVCQHYGVAWIDTFDLLDRLDARFILSD